LIAIGIPSQASYEAITPTATLNNTVDAFRAAEVRNAETRYSGLRSRPINLFIERHERKEVVDPFLHRQSRVPEGLRSAIAETRLSARRLNMLEGRFIIMDSYCLNSSVILTRESVGTFYTELLPQTNQGYQLKP
jgi:hypothetical protein